MKPEDRPMGEVLAAASRTLDHDKLDTAIARQRDHEDNRQILTRAQQRLEAEEDRHALLHTEKIESRAAIERTRESIAKLEALLEQEERNLRDIEIEDAAILRSIDSLRSQGVER